MSTTFEAKPADLPKTAPGLPDTIRRLLKPLASLQLTVVLFSFSMLLVFFGTVAQIDKGIWTVVDQYFWSWVVFVPLDLLAKFAHRFFFLPTETTFPGSFPLPAGKLLGLVMFVNLVAAQLVRFKLTWKRSGIYVLHAGMILLFVGEAITRMYQVEQRMTIDEGETVNYAEDTKAYELAFLTVGADGTETVTVVPHTLLVPGERIRHPELPVDVETIEYMTNSAPRELDGAPNRATTGLGTRMIAERRREVSGTDSEQKVDVPSAYIKVFKKGTDEVLGTHLVSVWQAMLKMPLDPITVDDKTYQLGLRNTRYYKSYSMHLKDFRFDRYSGTNKAKNFSSDVRVIDPSRNVDREHRIAMNEPLRFAGEAIFQGGFDDKTETTTILQVVRNPGWLIPYISCVMVTLGMMIHFGIYLIAFLRKQKTLPKTVTSNEPRKVAPPVDAVTRWLPVAIVGVLALYLISFTGRMFPKTEPFDLKAFSQIPVLDGGRWKPLDSFARVSYRMMSAREEVVYLDEWKQASPQFMVKKHPAIEWYLDVASKEDPTPDGRAGQAMAVKIDNDQVLALFKVEPRTGLLYSLKELAPRMGEFLKVHKGVMDKKKNKQTLDLYETKISQVGDRLGLYQQIAEKQVPLVIPTPGEAGGFESVQGMEQRILADVKRAFLTSRNFDPATLEKMPEAEQRKIIDDFRSEMARAIAENKDLSFWQTVLQLYRENKPEEFNKLVREYLANHPEAEPGLKAKVQLESWYNAFAPFYQCGMLYVIAVMLCIFSWTSCTEGFRRSAFAVLLMTAVLHGVALITRMYLQDRWLVFVTNLYSSAIFIGFGCVVLGLLLERIYPIGIGNLIAAVLGTATTIVSHQIAGSSDTLEMLQAVLDTNFWLATHVTTVTFGYTATFVAGAIGIAYLIAGLFTRTVTPEVNKMFNNMLYGVICFAVLLSFVGTVLGGIWADQSWGRFWGWDPKENGAVLIVVWNALILHARWCGLVKTRGIAALAIVGNMVTVWSWFGTNQLGIGLHAYGFDNTLAMVCTGLWVSHALLLLLAAVPQKHWLSFEKPTDPVVASSTAKPLGKVPKFKKK